MGVKSGQALAPSFVTSNATTGAAADATGDPVGTLYVDGAANAAVCTITKPAGTGIYKCAVTLPALTVGQVVAVHIAATVAGVAGAGFIFQDVADTYVTSDIEALVDDIGVAGAGLTAIPGVVTVTGNVNGSVGSVTGAVGSVTGAVGSVTGAVGSVAANGITATSIAADAINAAAVKADAVTKIQSGLATPTNITAGTITTVTNLTNAPTNGDLTAVMKTSVTTAATAATPTAAAVTGAVGSVTGDVGGNVTGSVGSVAGNVVGSVGSVAGAITVTTNSDKTGYSLAATGLDSITATTPTGVATTFPQKLVQVWHRFFGKVTMTATQLKTYDDAGTGTLTTQTLSDDSTTQTQGKAS